MIIFLSVKCFTVLFLMGLLIGCSIIPFRKGSQMGKSTYAIGGIRSKRTCAYNELGGQICDIVVRMY